jgi:uncharacterized protein
LPNLALVAAPRYLPVMKVADASILIVPGYMNSGETHWQTKWESRLSTAKRVEQAEWSKPVLEDWTKSVANAVNKADKPVVIVAHSLGIPTFIHALPLLKQKIAGAFMVAPPDVSDPTIRPKHLMTFGPYPRETLPFPAIVVGSRNDHYCRFEVAEDMAASWGAMFIDGGESGHINADSGHGPWPEGSMVFAKFLSMLQSPQ